MARWIIIAGIILIIGGILLQIAPWLFNWFGRLPGDIHIDKGRTQVYFPITSMIIISIVITIIINIVRRILG